MISTIYTLSHQIIQKGYILEGRIKEQEAIKISMQPVRDLSHHEAEALH